MEATQEQVDAEKAKMAKQMEAAKAALNPEQLSAVEQKELELRGTKCLAEIDGICKKYGFTIQVGPPQIQLVPLMKVSLPPNPQS